MLVKRLDFNNQNECMKWENFVLKNGYLQENKTRVANIYFLCNLSVIEKQPSTFSLNGNLLHQFLQPCIYII